MWWSRTAIPALCACLLLSGCGFEPMYGDKSAAAAASYSNIEIANIPDRDGQYLRNELIDRLYLAGRPEDAPYILKVAPLRVVTTDLGIQKDATATRAMTNIDTTLQLVEKSTGKVLLQRGVRETGGYNFLDNQFATLVSRESVKKNMLASLADDIVTQVGLYFHRAENGQLPVSIAKPVRDPTAPVDTPAVPSGDSAPKGQVVPTVGTGKSSAATVTP